MAKNKARLVNVEIYGEEYGLRGDDDRQYIQSLAAHVDKKMKEIAEGTPTVDSLKLAILAALNIADEYFQMKLETEKVSDLVSERADAIATMLDKSLA